MLKHIKLLGLTLLFTSSVSFANDAPTPESYDETLSSGHLRGFGIGAIVGEPTGLSVKAWLTETTAIDGAVAWSFSGENSLHLHADYLIHNYHIFHPESGALPVYFGLGGRIKFQDNNNNKIGIRIPVGIAYQFDSMPIDIFLEVVPIVDLTPDTDISLNAAIGARYFFNF